MVSKSLIVSLVLIGCFSSANLYALDTANESVKASKLTSHDFEVGDRAPTTYQQTRSALPDWQEQGLKPPKKQSQWVQIDDKYVMVQITNGEILEITPVKRGLPYK